MKEEIQRISRLVAEGKLSPEDASELIEAFVAADKAEAKAPPQEPNKEAPRDPFKGMFDNLERTVKGVDWKEVGETVESGAKRGFDKIRGSFEDLTKGRVNFGLFGNEEKREVRMAITVPAGKRLRVENPCGDVKIVGGADSGTILANAKVRGGTPDEAKARAQEYTVIVEESDSVVTVRQPDVSGLTVDLTIRLNEAANVEIRTEAGDVTVLDHPAGVRVNARSGNVRVRGAAGVVEVSADSGDLTVEDVESPSIALETKSGDLSLLRVRGNVNARTASGGIEMKESAGKVIALESVSGDVSLDLTEAVTGSLNVRTVSGDVAIDVPDGNDCRVSVSSLRGDVECALALEDEAKSEGRVTGRLGAGGGTLDVSAVTGDVRLRMRATAAA